MNISSKDFRTLSLHTWFGSFQSLEQLIDQSIHLFRKKMEITKVEWIQKEQHDLKIRFYFQNHDQVVLECREQKEYPVYPLQAGLSCYQFFLHFMMESSLIEKFAHLLESELHRFSQEEKRRIHQLNPLVYHVGRQFQGKPLSKVNVIFRDHLLVEKYNLFLALLKLGLSPNRCYIFPKEGQNLYFKQVYSELRHLGFQLVELKQNQRDFYSIVNSVAKQMVNQPAIVVDDGGDLIATLSQLSKQYQICMHPIETTSKGITLLEKLSICSIIDLANTSIKKELSLEIALSCVIRARDLLRHYHFTDCHVIGYGKLGFHVARLLRDMGVKVTVSDPSVERQKIARKNNFLVYSTAKEALQNHSHRYIFGCSGKPVMTNKELELLERDAVLITLSSQDLQPALRYLEKHAKKQSLHGIGDLYLDRKGRKYTAIGHGHAVNLYLSEGVSEPEYDRFTALILVTIVEAAQIIKGNQHEFVGIEHLCQVVKKWNQLLPC